MQGSISVKNPPIQSVLCLFALLAAPLDAATLPAGGSATVRAGDVSERWTLTAATLLIEPGGQALDIYADPDSTVTLDGATVRGGSRAALDLIESQSTIRNSALTSTGNMGLSVSTGLVFNGRTSTALVEGSEISGFGRGLNVSGSSSATLIDSTLTGTGNPTDFIVYSGLGMSLVGGEAILRNSTATGSNIAAALLAVDDGHANSRLVVDHSNLISQSGSAIVVSNLGIDPMLGQIEIRNNSSVTAANGILLQVGLPDEAPAAVTQAHLLIDSSTLAGDIQVAAHASADVVMANGASLTGNVNNIRSLSMAASTLNGTINQPVGSSATVSMTAQSSIVGDVTNVAALTLDASNLTGSVSTSPGSASELTLANGATLTGTVSNVLGIALDNSRMTGNILHDSPATGTLSLANGSSLMGTVTNAKATEIGDRSRFDMVNSSNVGALNLQGGVVNLRGGNDEFRVLTASSLDGTGTFALGTDLAAGRSDLVNIEGLARGSYGMTIQNSGADPTAGGTAQRVVHTQGGDANFKVLSDNGLVDLGAFSYSLERQGNDWYLTQRQDDPIISPSTQMAVAVFSAAPTVWYGELSTLRSRMGELRGGYDQGGFWGRTYGNKYRVSAADQVHYQQVQQGVSIGVDRALPTESGRWLLGIMGGYSDSRLNMRLGSDGRVDSYYLGVYGTWLADSGYYIDAVIKANRFENKANARMSDGHKAKGEYNNYGFGGSVEAGRHFKLDDNWFIEPYLQASALWVNGENYSMDNGMELKSNKANSLLGKAGAHVGKTIALQSGGYVQPYVKLAAAREFARNNDIRVNSTTFHDDLSGGRGELGAGVAIQLANALQLHVDLDYSNGKNIEQPWGMNIGFNLAW